MQQKLRTTELLVAAVLLAGMVAIGTALVTHVNFNWASRYRVETDGSMKPIDRVRDRTYPAGAR